MFKSAQYGVTVYEETYSRQIYIDGSGNYLQNGDISEEENEENKALFEKHSDEIQDLLKAARKRWENQI